MVQVRLETAVAPKQSTSHIEGWEHGSQLIGHQCDTRVDDDAGVGIVNQVHGMAFGQ